MLREAGVEVVTGVMEEEARALNKGVYDATNERPSLYYLEMGAERRMGLSIVCVRTCRSRSRFLSSPETSRLVHKLRSEVAAIMVGTRTALLDNPSLNVRHWSGNSPLGSCWIAGSLFPILIGC